MRYLDKVRGMRKLNNQDTLRHFRKEVESKLINYKYLFAVGPRPSYTSLELEGKKIWVIGSQPRNFYSSNFVLQNLDKLNPSLICLSDLHPTSHHEYIHYNSPSQCINPGFPYSDSDLPIKEKMFSFFDKEYNKNHYYFHNDAGTFFFAEPYTKTCINDDPLSVANWTYLERNSGLIASGAHPFMIHEDLCHSISLNRMREIFHLAVEECIRRGKSLGLEPLKMPMQVYNRIYDIMKAEYIEEFYKKRIHYSACVVKKASKSFKTTVVVHYDYHTDIMEKMLYDVEQDYKDVFVSKYFDGDIDEMIEKIVILSHLDNKIVRNWIEYEHDPFQFMFRGQFKHPVKELREAFDYYNEYYKGVLSNALLKDIDRIQFMSNRGRSVESFSESAKKIAQRKGEFIVGHYQSVMIEKMRCELLKKQIIKNITSKIEKGLNQNEELLALEQIGKGENTTFNTEILMRLMAEANSQLKVMKLPKEFRRFEDKLFTRMSMENFYGYVKGIELPRMKEKFLNGLKVEEDGDQFMIVGPGDMPEQLKGKSLKEIKNMNLETVYETPVDMFSGKPLKEDAKDYRSKIKTFEEFNNKQ